MAVGFRIDFLWYQVGHGDFLHSFFSTICYQLENNQWGSKYPYLMNKLYNGELSWTDIDAARKELKDIQERLADFPPSSVIWDADDLTKLPPWGNDISPSITNLSNYFITSDGRDLITTIFKVFDEAEELRHNIEVISL